MTKRTRIKICGITRLEDALLAIEQGADALGFVFYEKSPRYISPADAASICSQLPVFVEKVGLFVDEAATTVETISQTVGLTLLQFHGSEDEAYCASFTTRYMKAIRVKNQQDVIAAFEQYPSSGSILLDTYVAGVQGGTGQAFDWSVIPLDKASQIVLAGGLNADNVKDAIVQLSPYGVDISGGVESAPGIKSFDKIQSFIAAVSAGDAIK
jgi:phosphoribosylanthranilate isomerase